MTLKELFIKIGMEVDEGSFDAVEKMLGHVKLGALAVGAAVGAIVGAVMSAANETAATAKEVEKAAQRIGIGTTEIQELNFAAKETGVSAETLEMSMRRLANSAFNASEGSAEMSQAFREMGVSTKDASGKLKDPDQLLTDLAEKFSKMPDGIKKTALAQKIFSRGGAEMIPFLNKGREGLAEMREEAHKLGIVMSKEELSSIKEYTERQKHLHAVIEGFTTRVGVQAIKALNALHHAFVTLFPDIHSLVRVLSIAGAALVVWQAQAIGAALYAAGAWILAALPFIALGVAIAGVILFIDELWTYLEGGETVLAPFFDSIKKIWTDFKDAADGTMQEIFAMFTRWGENIRNFFTGIWDSITGGLKDGLNSIIKHVPSFLGGGGELFGGGAASPQASVQSTVNTPGATPEVKLNAPQISNNVTVNAQTGANPEEIASAIDKKTEEFWSAKMSHASGGTF